MLLRTPTWHFRVRRLQRTPPGSQQLRTTQADRAKDKRREKAKRRTQQRRLHGYDTRLPQGCISRSTLPAPKPYIVITGRVLRLRFPAIVAERPAHPKSHEMRNNRRTLGACLQNGAITCHMWHGTSRKTGAGTESRRQPVFSSDQKGKPLPSPAETVKEYEHEFPEKTPRVTPVHPHLSERPVGLSSPLAATSSFIWDKQLLGQGSPARRKQEY